MNITTAADLTVHEFKGGSQSLGPLVGITPAVLRNKVNPNNTTHHLTLAEAVRICRMTADFRILTAWAHEAGFLLVKAPSHCQAESDMSVLEQLVGFMVASGVYGQEIHKALADGGVDRQELTRIREAGAGVMTAVGELNTRLEGMADE
ncbi:phage regulatory CII family protein [Achromobacter xylosoxidans]|uniref:phage regulatory CII family protein n=1 Tax=Alcaligenes xylosoxydans xylosoxydans TaxID=85698 RepID=UPI0006C45ED0|nr:phage regulatory CII family protein [Achromobacter xylosoxidans]CUJ62287.1 Phage regulatory protein CII (CP76) [Achromobacter xylosoxidans]